MTDDKKYWLGISDFLSGGGDGFDMIRDERLFYQKGKDDASVLVDEIKKRNPITAQNTGTVNFAEFLTNKISHGGQNFN